MLSAIKRSPENPSDNWSPESAIQLLLEKGLNVDGISYISWLTVESEPTPTTPLLCSANFGLGGVMRILLKFGASWTNKLGQTLHHEAASEEKCGKVKWLVSAFGADIGAVDQDSDTPSFLAAKYGHVEILKILHRLGANLHHRNKEGETALHAAVEYGNAQAANFLLGHGCKVDSQNGRDCLTPLHISARDGNVEILRILASSKRRVLGLKLSPRYLKAGLIGGRC